MASFSMSTVYPDYDMFKDYFCTICQEQRFLAVDSDFYCKTCHKYFCGKCIHSHEQHGWLFYKQSPFGKDRIQKWPLFKKIENFLLRCYVHKDEQLTMYCPDQNELCCSECVKRIHRMCSKGTPLSQAAKENSTDFKNLSVITQNTLSRLNQFQTYEEDRMKSLKVSFNEHEKDMVESLRLKITSCLLQYKNITLHEPYEHVQCTINEICGKVKSLLSDFEKSMVKENKKELTLKLAPLMIVRNNCIRIYHELLQLHLAIQKVMGRLELSFIASTKCQENIKEFETYLENNFPNFPNHIFTVIRKYEYCVKIPSDSHTCFITATCVLPEGKVLVVDHNNDKLKLLNQQYQVLSHCGVNATPWDLCLITPSEVAVTVNDNTVKPFIFVGTKFRPFHKNDYFVRS